MTDKFSILLGKEVFVPGDVIQQSYSASSSKNAGCWIRTQDVNSVCSGTVIAVDRDEDYTWAVTVEIDSRQWVRYCALSSAKVLISSSVEVGTPIGYGYKNLMRFEYCTATKSKYPVRLLRRQLYKNDPTPVLFGQINLEANNAR